CTRSLHSSISIWQIMARPRNTSCAQRRWRACDRNRSFSRTAFGRAAKSLRVDQWLLWASWETSGAGVRGTVTLAGPIAFALPPRSAHRPKGRIPICMWRESLVLVVVLVLGIRDRAVEDEARRRTIGLRLRRAALCQTLGNSGRMPAARWRKTITAGKVPAARWPAEQDHALKAD